MSVDRSSSTPPPAQSPLTAATIGLEKTWCFRSAWPTTAAFSGDAERSPLRSAPAQKARSPAPVRTITRQGPRSSSSQSRARSAIICRDIALRRGWLSMVMTTTCRACWWTRISTSVPQIGKNNDLAVRLAIGQQANGLDALLEREPVADARLELAGGVPREQLVDRPAELVGRLPAEVAQRAPQRGAVLDEKPVRRDLLDPAHEADDQDAPAPAERRERRVEEIATDRVETHVGALVVRELHDSFGELLGRVVDDLVGAALASHRELLRGARRRDDACAHRLADLDRGEPHTAGGPQDQQRLAGLQAALPVDRHVARDVGDRKSARFLEAHPGGDRDRLRLGRDRHLRGTTVGVDSTCS